MRTRLSFLTAALASVAVAAAPASADRRPSATERAAIASASGLPTGCLVVRISTVDERWAVAKLRRCNLGNGVALYRRGRAGAWRQRYMGPDDGRSPCGSYITRRAPARVARDLGVCR